jgi:hypothetical protein
VRPRTRGRRGWPWRDHTQAPEAIEKLGKAQLEEQNASVPPCLLMYLDLRTERTAAWTSDGRPQRCKHSPELADPLRWMPEPVCQFRVAAAGVPTDRPRGTQLAVVPMDVIRVGTDFRWFYVGRTARERGGRWRLRCSSGHGESRS